jgi:hypothetical protein
MNSSNPGAEKMNAKWITSLPIFVTEIQVLAGINTVASPCTSLDVELTQAHNAQALSAFSSNLVRPLWDARLRR